MVIWEIAKKTVIHISKLRYLFVFSIHYYLKTLMIYSKFALAIKLKCLKFEN